MANISYHDHKILDLDDLDLHYDDVHGNFSFFHYLVKNHKSQYLMTLVNLRKEETVPRYETTGFLIRENFKKSQKNTTRNQFHIDARKHYGHAQIVIYSSVIRHLIVWLKLDFTLVNSNIYSAI